MAARRPRTLEELLCGLDISGAGGATPFVEDAVVPSVSRILEEEEVSEVNLGLLDDGKSEVSDNFQDSEEEGYWSEDEDFWLDLESEDSCYASTSEDEEDEEDPDGLVPVSPRSAPPASSLSSSTSTCVDSHEDPRPSTSGLNSTKRSRAEDNTLQVRVKRQRRTCVDSPEDPRPSTSGLNSTKSTSEESNTGQVCGKRQRKTRECHPEERRASTSSLSSSTVDQWWLDLSNSDED